MGGQIASLGIRDKQITYQSSVKRKRLLTESHLPLEFTHKLKTWISFWRELLATNYPEYQQNITHISINTVIKLYRDVYSITKLSEDAQNQITSLHHV